MHQAVVITRFPYSSEAGGIESFTQTLAISLRDAGMQVVFVGRCPFTAALLSQEGVQVRTPYLPKSPVSLGSMLVFLLLLPYSIARSWLLVRDLPETTSLYCLSLTDKLLLTPFALRSGMRVIWGEHESLQTADGKWRRWLVKNPLFSWYKRLSRRVSVVCASPALERQFLSAGIAATSIPLALSAADLGDVGTRTEAGHRADTIVIGTSARLKAEKGLLPLLQAFARLQANDSRLRLAIFGDGPYRDVLQAEARRLGVASRVTLHGIVPHADMPARYRSLDIAVFPALQPETFGLAPLEAMAQGVATIVSPRFGFLAATPDEPFLVVDPSDAESFENAIRNLVLDADARHALGQQQQEYVRSHFAPSSIMQRYAALFAAPHPTVA